MDRICAWCQELMGMIGYIIHHGGDLLGGIKKKKFVSIQTFGKQLVVVTFGSVNRIVMISVGMKDDWRRG